MVVGHSLGGVASLLANTQNQITDKLVMISSPTIGKDILQEFASGLNASERNIHYLLASIEKQFDRPFESVTAEYLIQKLTDTDLLLIYDSDDSQVPLSHPQRLVEQYPTAKLITTNGLGHYRILRDPAVVEHTFEHLQSVQV